MSRAKSASPKIPTAKTLVISDLRGVAQKVDALVTTSTDDAEVTKIRHQ
jgi:hypothetical protein